MASGLHGVSFDSSLEIGMYDKKITNPRKLGLIVED